MREHYARTSTSPTLSEEFEKSLNAATSDRQVLAAISRLLPLTDELPHKVSTRALATAKERLARCTRGLLDPPNESTQEQINRFGAQIDLIHLYQQLSIPGIRGPASEMLPPTSYAMLIAQKKPWHSSQVHDHVFSLAASEDSDDGLKHVIQECLLTLTSVKNYLYSQAKHWKDNSCLHDNLLRVLVDSRIIKITKSLQLLYFESVLRHEYLRDEIIRQNEARRLYTELITELPDVLQATVQRQLRLPHGERQRDRQISLLDAQILKTNNTRSVAEKLHSCGLIEDEAVLHENELSRLKLDIDKNTPIPRRRTIEKSLNRAYSHALANLTLVDVVLIQEAHLRQPIAARLELVCKQLYVSVH